MVIDDRNDFFKHFEPHGEKIDCRGKLFSKLSDRDGKIAFAFARRPSTDSVDTFVF